MPTTYINCTIIFPFFSQLCNSGNNCLVITLNLLKTNKNIPNHINPRNSIKPSCSRVYKRKLRIFKLGLNLSKKKFIIIKNYISIYNIFLCMYDNFQLIFSLAKKSSSRAAVGKCSIEEHSHSPPNSCSRAE